MVGSQEIGGLRVLRIDQQGGRGGGRGGSGRLVFNVPGTFFCSLELISSTIPPPTGGGGVDKNKII